MKIYRLKGTVCIFLLIFSNLTFAQLSEDFSDGDFSLNPTWAGTTADYVVNTNGQLQLNASVAGTSYLSVQHQLASFDNVEWNFWVRQNFAGSSSNYGRMYLIADQADLSTFPDGIYLQLGEALSTDAVRLMQRVAGVSTQIGASADGTIANAFQIGVRISRNQNGMWSMYLDLAGGSAYQFVGSWPESQIPTGSLFGYLNTYTAGNSTRFYLDNIYVGPEIVDQQGPELSSVAIVNPTTLTVTINEFVTAVSANNVSNYSLSPTIAIAYAVQNASNAAEVQLTLQNPLLNGTTYVLSAMQLEDLTGNVTTNDTISFTYLVAEIALPGDVVINEFFADPTPVIGLPEIEFVEILNVSSKVFQLGGWKLGDNATFGTIGNAWLMPGQHVVLCPSASVNSFTNAVGVTSFPSLNNVADDVVLQTNDGTELDRLSFDLSWYQDEVKKDGGWTLERINPYLPCSNKANWSASIDPTGGTPGSSNSIFSSAPDLIAPSITHIEVLTASQIEVFFSESITSANADNVAISFSPNLNESGRVYTGINPSSLVIDFSDTIMPSVLYEVTFDALEDCSGNSAIVHHSFVLADMPQVGDVVINEILFDPPTGGSDWIELYNNSSKILNLQGWKIARKVNGNLSDVKVVTNSYFLMPGEYVVLGADSQFIKNNYPVVVESKYIQMALPSMPNDTGNVHVLFPLNDSTTILIDGLVYSSKWHFKLLDNNDGKSLERLDVNQPTQNRNNWYTAAEAQGFGTPGRRNSQYIPAEHGGEISFTSETISPDNDGFEDVLQINYQMKEVGMIATLSIFDDRGRLIKDMSQNELMGMTGSIIWDGIRNDGQKAAIGTYVLVFEAYNSTSGTEFIAKKPFVVAGKL